MSPKLTDNVLLAVCWSAVIIHWLTSMPEERGELPNVPQLPERHRGNRGNAIQLFVPGRFVEIC